VAKAEIENLIESRIQTDFRFFKNKNINLVNLGQINKIILATFPEIAKVSSVKNYPQKLAFNIEERTPSAIFEQNGNWFFADNEGIVFEKTDEKVASSSDFAIIRNSLLSEELKLGDGIAEKETISRIMDLQSKMRYDLKIPVKELAIVSQERLNAKTAEGWDAYFDLQGDLDWQFTKLKTVLEKRIPPEKRGNLIYIDLRFDRIYIYPETYNE
jgi:DNA gyrase/topoisomerase IV subunit A